MFEPDNDVGDLHTGVVDVVLHRDLVTGCAQQTHKGIAQDSVAQMADVRSFVGIDAGVLNKSVLRRAGRCLRLIERKNAQRGRPVEPRIDVTGPGDLKGSKAFHGAERSDDLFRNLARRFAQRARKLQRDRDGVFTEADFGRLLDREGGGLETVEGAQSMLERKLELFLSGKVHGSCFSLDGSKPSLNRCAAGVPLERVLDSRLVG